MEIILKQTDPKEAYAMFGIDKKDILEKIWKIITPIFEKYVEKAVKHGYENNDFMYPMKDYLRCSEVIEFVAEDYANEVHKALHELPVYIQGPRMYPTENNDENLWHWTVTFEGRELEIGIRNVDKLYNK